MVGSNASPLKCTLIISIHFVTSISTWSIINIHYNINYNSCVNLHSFYILQWRRMNKFKCWGRWRISPRCSRASPRSPTVVCNATKPCGTCRSTPMFLWRYSQGPYTQTKTKWLTPTPYAKHTEHKEYNNAMQLLTIQMIPSYESTIQSLLKPRRGFILETCCDLFHTFPHHRWGPLVFTF